MRKIEKDMLAAIANKTNWANTNTRVEYQPEVSTTARACIEYAKVFLHDNHIATVSYGHMVDGKVRVDYNPVTLREWPTRTTLSRLNALGIKAGMRKGIVYVNEKAL
jgi:hypothetical protein